MKSVILSVAGIALAGTAYAGGLSPAPQEPVVMSPAPAAATPSTWTGGYGGLSLGYGTFDLEGDPSTITGLGDSADLDDLTEDADGVLGGVYGGYQYEFGSGLVLGGELDLNAANLDVGDDDFFGGDVFSDDEEDVDGPISLDQIHRLKLRAGYGLGESTLLYGTVGAAYAEAEILGNDYSDTGYVIGAGVDYKVTDSVTVGGEVNYHQWDDFDDTGLDVDATTVQARVGYSF